MHTDNRFLILSLVLAAASFLLASGCISNIDSQDKLSVDLDHAPVYNFSRYVNASMCLPVNNVTPCTCMLCTADKASWGARVLSLIGLGDIEFSLNNSQCYFRACNYSMYNDTITNFIADKASAACRLSDTDTTDKICAPRYFMLGQGSNPADYAAAQRYCDGQLKMPVIWAVPNESGMLAKMPVQPATLSCYLTKDQMPVVVWYSAGKFIDGAGYTDMVKNLSQPKASVPLSGPVMVTTEAMLNPYKADGITLDFDKLAQVGRQLGTIRANCPKCLSVLALNTTTNSSYQPDLCALDYFLNNNTMTPRPDICAAAYAGSSMWTDRTNLIGSVDLIGVGFDANADPHVPSCSAEAEVGRHLGYARAALTRYYKPSVWYALAISPGPTADANCTYTEADVQNVWSTMIGSIPALVSSGVIGVAPYRFSDNPDNAPLPFAAERYAFNSTLTSLDVVRAVTKAGELTVVSQDSTRRIVVARYLAYLNDSNRQAAFLGGDDIVYAARVDGSGVGIWALPSQTGFTQVGGEFRSAAAYTWFSNCEYYYTNLAPLFHSNKTMTDVVANAKLDSSDNRHHITVSVIEHASDNETQFIGTDDRRYSARPDGNGTKLYERPIAAQSTQQPLMFSTNGRGSMCSAYETTKLYSRTQVISSPDGSAPVTYNLTQSQNVDDRKRIADLACTGGGCLATVPMPTAFCYRFDKVKFDVKYCTVYPQIEDAVGAQNFDSMFMRAIFQAESSFRRTAMSKNESTTACQTDKSCDDIGTAAAQTAAMDDPALPASPSPLTIQSTCDKIQKTDKNHVCALGLAQCIEPPFSSADAAKNCGSNGGAYNPFNPFDSACCGTYKIVNSFSGSTGAGGWLKKVQDKTASDPVWRAFIKPGEEEWYAAWFTMRNYRGAGPNMDDLDYTLKQPQSTQDLYGGPVGYVDQVLYANNGVQNYSTNTIIRYNDALNKCGAGCPYQPCTGGSGGGGSSTGGSG